MPVDNSAEAEAAQRAGQISRSIPEVAIARGTQQTPAPVKALVDWGDVVRTGDGGRARLALDDGSVLNVGSSSTLTVTQHNAAAQQTQIELTYGRVRSQVIKQTKPNAKFEIHTSVGVAGVVGAERVSWASTDAGILVGAEEWCPREKLDERLESVSPFLAAAIGRMGMAQIKLGRVADALTLAANYVRRTDAELHWNATTKKAAT